MSNAVGTAASGSRRTTKREQVYDALYRHIVSGLHPPGSRLTPVMQLAKQFNSGVRSVQQALDELEAQGYIERKHGSGTFVTGSYRSLSMNDVVALCMEARGHLWADLCGMLMEGLAERECAGVVIGTELKDRHRRHLIQRIAHSEAGAYIVQGNTDFPFDVFEYPALRQRTIIAVVEWVSDRRWPELHRVLHDSAAGGRLVAEHLWEQGHRRVLCVNTLRDHGHFEELPPNQSARGHAFVHEWTRRGGHWQAVGHDFEDLAADQLGDDFAACFRQSDPPTAVFGIRDYEAWLAQQTIRQQLPELDGRVAIVGYGDTPWSQAGAPPFTTISYDLAQIAREVMKILDAKRTGKGKCPELVNVPPELIVRRTSVRAGRMVDG